MFVFLGILIDLMDSLDPGMYMSGSLTIMGGLVMMLIPIFKKSSNDRIVEVVL